MIDYIHTTWYHKSHRLFKKLPNVLILKFISHQINIHVPTYVKLRLIIDRQPLLSKTYYVIAY